MRNWRSRLTPLQQQIYDRSAAIAAIQLTPTPQLFAATQALEVALSQDDHPRVELCPNDCEPDLLAAWRAHRPCPGAGRAAF